MATSISQKNRYTFSALIFLVFFLLSLFLFSKRAIQPTIYTFRDLNSQTPYLHFLFSSPTQFEQQINSSIGQPISPISENKAIDSDFRDAIVNGELSVEDEKDPVLENDSFTEIIGNGADTSENKSIDSDFRDGIINGELSVEDEKNPVLENDSFTEMVDSGGYISENKSIDSDFRGGIIKGELSVEDEKNPVLGKEFSTEMVDNGGDISFEEELKRLRKCDLYMGTWVKDEEYPFYKPGSCPYVDEGFSCQSNGRGDSGYLKWRWKPDGCDLPRFNATDFLVRLSGKRLMLVGDSMNRNQFESILCLLREGLSNKSRMYEVHGYKITNGRGYYIFKFEDYDCTVEFVRSHFLVKEGIRKNAQGNSNPTLSIDQIDKSARRWKRADIIIFNTGHWWTHGKTARGKNYYKEGDFIYPQFDAVEAYRRALRTWAKWINNNVNRKRQMVFYRGYSSAHFRGGDWDSGGTCNGETEPISGGAFLDSYPLKMKIVEEVIQEMQVPVILLNVTRLTNFRKDGHPSIYGKNVTAGKKVSTRRQDCSHWCLPGVPDAWNELIYATLVLQ